MQLQHRFTYTLTESDDMNFPNMRVDMKIDGETTNLDAIIKQFETYLISTGFVLPDNTHVGLVENEESSLKQQVEEMS